MPATLGLEIPPLAPPFEGWGIKAWILKTLLTWAATPS